MPDPIPGIVRRRWAGAASLVLFGGGGVAFCAAAYLAFFSVPEGWIFLVWASFLCAAFAASAYAKSLKRTTPLESILDFTRHAVWETLKLLLLANVVCTFYDVMTGIPPREALPGFAARGFRLAGILSGGGFSLFHVACLAALLGPVRTVWRTLSLTMAFERELAPRRERRIDRQVVRGRRLLARGKEKEGLLLLDKAAESLADLTAGTTNKGLLYHRRLLQEKIRFARGQAASSEFVRDPFGDGAARDGGAELSVSGTQESGAARVTSGPNAPDQGYEQYREYLNSLRERSSVKFSEVAGLDDLIEDLKTSFGMALAEAPDGVTLDPPKRILLYGPPGTGKTLLTAAVSNSLDAAFFNVKVSDVLSKFFGESTRLISALFRLAAEESPAILFFDEIEAISGSRDATGGEGEEKRMVSALLAELDGLRSKDDKSTVFTIAATNMPWQLDAAILSRFDKQYYLPLPGREARRRLIDIHLAERGHECEVATERIVKFTRGYSGRELRRLCQEAIRLMLAEANPKMSRIVEKGREAVQKYQLKVAPICVPHLNAAFRKVRPQTRPEVLAKYKRWKSEN